MRRGSKQHEAELLKAIKDMESKGYKVVNLHGVCPDAIAIKNNYVIAVEVLGKDVRNNPKSQSLENHASWTFSGKKRQYRMFDDVKIFVFIRDKTGFSNDDEIINNIINILLNCDDKIKANDIWDKLPYFVSQRRVRDILKSLEINNIVNSQTCFNGRYGTFKQYWINNNSESGGV